MWWFERLNTDPDRHTQGHHLLCPWRDNKGILNIRVVSDNNQTKSIICGVFNARTWIARDKDIICCAPDEVIKESWLLNIQVESNNNQTQKVLLYMVFSTLKRGSWQTYTSHHLLCPWWDNKGILNIQSDSDNNQTQKVLLYVVFSTPEPGSWQIIYTWTLITTKHKKYYYMWWFQRQNGNPDILYTAGL